MKIIRRCKLVITIVPLTFSLGVALWHCIFVKDTGGNPLDSAKVEVCAEGPADFCDSAFTGRLGKACIDIPDTIPKVEAIATKPGYQTERTNIRPTPRDTSTEIRLPAEEPPSDTPKEEDTPPGEPALPSVVSQCFRAVDTYERPLHDVLITVCTKDLVHHGTTDYSGKAYVELKPDYAGSSLRYEAWYNDFPVQKGSFVLKDPTEVRIIKFETHELLYKVKFAVYDDTLGLRTDVKLLFSLRYNGYCEWHEPDFETGLISVEIPYSLDDNMENDFLCYESLNDGFEHKVDCCSISSIRGIVKILLRSSKKE